MNDECSLCKLSINRPGARAVLYAELLDDGGDEQNVFCSDKCLVDWIMNAPAYE